MNKVTFKLKEEIFKGNLDYEALNQNNFDSKKIYTFKEGFFGKGDDYATIINFRNLDFDENYMNQMGGDIVRLTEDQFKIIYKDNTKTSVDDSKVSQKSNEYVKSTYGEILPTSVDKMIDIIKIGPDDVFYDLGSGMGKVTMQMFANTSAKKCCGIEYFPERAFSAKKALKKLYKLFPSLLDDDRIISYQVQNIKDVHYLDDATIVFMCSTCYPEELLDIVYEKLKNSDKLRYLITHKRYDKFKNLLPNLREVELPCTWSKNLIWFFYYKN
jgi:Histone methylation protein DOT1.